MAAAANQASGLEDAVRASLPKMCACLNSPLGHLWLPCHDAPEELVSAELWHPPEAGPFDSFRRATEGMRWARGVGLPGQVLADGSPLWNADLTTEVAEGDRADRAAAAREVGLAAALALPILTGAEVAGVLELFASSPAQPDRLLLEVLAQVGRELGTVVQRERAERSARESEALRESEERYARLTRGSGDGFWDWDLRTDELYLSPASKAMLGHGETEIATTVEAWFGRIHPEDVDGIKEAIIAHLDGLTPHLEFEYRALHEGGPRWILCRGLAVRDRGGRAVRLAGSQTDIDDRRLLEEQLMRNAFRDPLTGLPNRALFMDRLRGALARGLRRGGCTFAVLLVDVDHLKVLNERLGRSTGDQLLAAMGRRLAGSLRQADTVARLGGDEFAILLENVRHGEAEGVAQRILAELAAPFMLEGREVLTRASIGVALGSPEFDRGEDLVRDAEVAMLRAQALGSASTSPGEGPGRICGPGERERPEAHLFLEAELRRAVDRREFRVHYQPIVSLETGRTAGFEALARWERPDGSLVLPPDFLHVAEETGLIVPLGGWLLRESCRQARLWQARLRGNPGLVVSVNLSCRELAEAEVGEQVEQVLEETGLAAESLRIEINEAAILENTESAKAILLGLKELGVGLYLDDFGKGHSSLSYLRRLPFDAVKVDPSFIGRIGTDEQNLEPLQRIVALAHNLGIEVIAKGVETAEQLAGIKALGCEYGQGYLFARPMDLRAAGKWLAEGTRVSVAT